MRIIASYIFKKKKKKRIGCLELEYERQILHFFINSLVKMFANFFKQHGKTLGQFQNQFFQYVLYLLPIFKIVLSLYTCVHNYLLGIQHIINFFSTLILHILPIFFYTMCRPMPSNSLGVSYTTTFT